jgi:hypothetical protein
MQHPFGAAENHPSKEFDAWSGTSEPALPPVLAIASLTVIIANARTTRRSRVRLQRLAIRTPTQPTHDETSQKGA